MPINGWINKEDVVCTHIYIDTHTHTHTYIYTHTHNDLLLRYKSEWNHVLSDNMEGHRGYYVKWNKFRKRYINSI